MDVTIEQSCPSCGAAIILNEDDRLIQCDFCSVHNYKIGNGAGRFILPARLPDHIDEKQLIFAPYLRFKGSVFYIRDNDVKYKIVDTTRLGLTNQLLPVSLGLRPQAMQIKPVVAATPGAFLHQSMPTKTVFAHAAMVVDLFAEQDKKICHHRAFIGETISCIYQPCYVKEDHLYDAVTNRVVGHSSQMGDQLQKTSAGKSAWEPKFIATLCPKCGGLLGGERDTIILQCGNCQTLWQEQNGRFVAVGWTVVGTEDQGAHYLPFWRISFTTSGYGLKYFADFLRFTNQPLVPLPKYENRPLVFLIPAFKLNPKAFLQLASQLTVGQTRIPSGQTGRMANHHPVTLDQLEALQAIKSVLAYSTLNKEQRLSMLSEIRLKATSYDLTYLPFIAKTHDLVQEHTFASVQTAAMRYGRSL